MEVDGGRRADAGLALAADEIEIDVPLLIADGHHRYETAVAFREEEPSATHTFAVLVSSRAPGLEIFPTHRVVQRVGDEPGRAGRRRRTAALALYRDGTYFRVESDDELDTREVEEYAPQGVEYTPNAEEAIEAVDRGEARPRSSCARPSTQVVAFARARRDDAAEVDVLLPEAHLRPALLPRSERLARAVPRGASPTCKTVLVEMPTREERERPIGQGEGRRHHGGARRGGRERRSSKHFDLRRRPDRLGGDRDQGRRRASRSSSTRSTARRTPSAAIPYFALCVAVAEGDTMDDVVFGFVHDFGSGEEWTAVRGGGAFLNGEPLTGAPKDEHRVPVDRGDAGPSSSPSRREARAAHRPGAR